MNTENNKNNNIFNDDISIGTIVRVRKSCFFVCARRIHHNRRKYFNGHIIVTERKEK